MKFKTRLRITFAVIIILPLVLSALAFFLIGLYLMDVQKGLPVESFGYNEFTENMQEMLAVTDDTYVYLREQIKRDPSKLEDKAFLEMVNTEVARRSTYIVVRKG